MKSKKIMKKLGDGSIFLAFKLRKNRTVPLILILIGCLFLLNGCTPGKAKEKPPEAIPVKVDKVKLQELSETLDYSGDIKAQDEAVIYPKVSGKIIEKVKEDGALINKGEVICYVDRDEVGLKFQKAPVESTLTGILGRVYVDIGQNVTANTPVALVVSVDKVKIELDIPEKYLPKITLGQQAQISVDSWPLKEFTGSVTKVSPVIDLSTRTAPVEITAQNKEYRLQSGMFAKVRLVIETRKNVPVILREAIMGHDPDNYVFLVQDKKAVYKKISLGIRQGPYFEVRQGLAEGDLVVIMGQQLLADGVSVEPEETKE
ncbi:MAG: efflux RND transporter periplasmic adaptor subunit [Candidatus Omnitrophica bacterium]|nr:efflux RND transporter periplasmic adaptor subunit [Candidatus Omnitrophota bacterium]MBU4302918.1 efflux RND transporter periplasmic adaptor subunit [Candidatus Omnitrophota bacterium]MBU4468318.1 efflux RND transporter periplasmic adaptor subunit [Candidatus Omnitrophota bacterium]MCG2707206.1 efflux RND transporter periplasmic adaptor subunit [Candidatus Omnitrophota bacterium]